MNVDIYYDTLEKSIVDSFAESLREHIAHVQEAGRLIGVSETQLSIHDLSKWSMDEFIGYAKHFKGGGAPDEFASAWLHHIHFNPHHPEYWFLPDRDGFPLGFSKNTSDILAKADKFIKAHIALGSVDANSNPLKVIEFMGTSFGLGDNVVDAGVESWDKLFSGNSAPIVLLFQLFKNEASEFFIIMTAGVPDDCSPMEQAVLPTSGNGWFTTSDAKPHHPMFLPDSFVPVSVFAFPDDSLPFGHFDTSSGPLSGLFVQGPKLNQLSGGHFSFPSNRESHVVSLALDALLRTSKLFGEQRGAICLIPTAHDFLFFGCPVLGKSFIHTNLQYPVLNMLYINTGYYTTNYQWSQFATPIGSASETVSSLENGIVEMPLHYVTEMVADWMGAGRTYTGSWDMTDWLWNHIPKIKVHSKTANHLRGILDSLGYADIVYIKKFSGEE